MVPIWNHYGFYTGGYVRTLTIKNIPDKVLKRLKSLAAMHRRSLNGEVIACLEQLTGTVPFDPASVLAQARELRKQSRGPLLTDKRLAELKAAGRP